MLFKGFYDETVNISYRLNIKPTAIGRQNDRNVIQASGRRSVRPSMVAFGVVVAGSLMGDAMPSIDIGPW